MRLPPLAIAGLVTSGALLTAAAFGVSPSEASRQKKLALSASTAARLMSPVDALLRASSTPGMLVVDLSALGGSAASIIGGSEDASGLLSGSASPADAIAQISASDEKWAPAIDAYRQLHFAQDQNAGSGGILGPNPGAVWGYRYPTRFAVLRATMDVLLMGSDPLAQKYGNQWAISDVSSGQLKDSWLRVVATYAPSKAEWDQVAAQVAEHYNPTEKAGILDRLSSALGIAYAGVMGQWGAVARGIFGGTSTTGAAVGDRPLSIEEKAILDFLKRKQSPVQVIRFDLPKKDYSKGNTYTATLTWAEALSGGGTPLARGIASLGGVNKIASEIRAGVSALTIATKNVSDEVLTLKACAVSRRWPTPGNSTRADLQTVYYRDFGNWQNMEGSK